MKPRGEEFIANLGKDGPGHAFYDDTEFDEVEEEDDINDTDKREELKNGRTKN